MLSSSGSSTSNNLQRTRSTTSVKDRRKHPLQAESIDPYTARTHALIAAHRAVDRSRASTSTDLGRSESVATRTSAMSSRAHNITFSPATHLRRQRSTLQTRVPRLAESLQAPGLHFYGDQTCKKSEYTTEFGLQGESYGAEPSSYRRLRRSKSLLTPTRQVHCPLIRTPETSISQAPTLRTAGSSTESHSPSLKVRLKRSLNFLRQPPRTVDRLFTAPPQLPAQVLCHSDATVLARSQFHEHSNGQDTSKKPSSLSASRTKRIGKTFRKSLRTIDSLNSEAPLVVGNQNKIVQNPEQRSLSVSLSGKVKRLFAKSKPSDVIPPQQLEASRPHFNIDLVTSCPEAGFDSYLDPEPASTKRNSPYIPSEAHADICDLSTQLSRRLSKSRSCDSLSSRSKSRVTSWTNSTNTVSSEDAGPSICAPNRLSIIKEDGGPHQPSSSAGRHIGGVPVFQQPLNLAQGSTIDSQRIYSALIKRIDEEQKEMEKTREALNEIHETRDQDQVLGHYLFSTPTIRRVESKTSALLTKIDEDQVSEHGRVSSIVDAADNPGVMPIYRAFASAKVKTQHVPGETKFQSYSSDDESRNQSSCNALQQSMTVESRARSSDPVDDGAESIIRGTENIVPQLSNKLFGQSTKSVYSRTTNGGTNLDYVSPIGSAEDLRPQLDTDIGLDAALMSANPPVKSYERPPSRAGPNSSARPVEKGGWNLWMNRQLQDVAHRRAATRTTHIREHAQIDSDDTDVGNVYRSSVNQARDSVASVQCRNGQVLPNVKAVGQQSAVLSESQKSESSPWHLKEVSSNHASTTGKDSSLRRSQSALLGQTNNVKCLNIDSRRPCGMGRIQTNSVGRILKFRTSQPMLSSLANSRKENSPLQKGESPPVSTPGKYQLERQSANSTGCTNRGNSAIGFRGEHDGPWLVSRYGASDDSPSEKLKSALSARLSKPFDMDIPDRNRPFDSTYLGKREAGDGNRLSVAPGGNTLRRPKTYGDLGRQPYRYNESPGNSSNTISAGSALPPTAGEFASRSVSGRSLGSAGRRILSTLLKSRKRQEDDDTVRSATRSPAFI